ncbi:twin arginine targeting protein translocase subunit TatC [Aequorivita sublithincola DSM 14238]|uniref:Sec-independent protein translocase protein TatC n=1 Tax=Aequorivita sublithincola (strain DSM 14238 / LMG 21431 / ACAM 643 / 9-3) TaxID=746697 RepID=I3YXK3_AEQSU|nr:twin-arginine translocase subunit TatC [Aequorivita sublithincola]AFL81721.1 twin arginine targeting protein translocase subunit TatC [Aequorivita sublithincola DSM 14238]
MKKKKNDSPEKEMSFLDHLEELRWHLVRSTLAVLILAVIAFIFKRFIFDVLIFGPSKPGFITYSLFCDISRSLGLDTFCFQEMPFKIQSRTMAGQFSAHMWTSIYAGIIVAFPYILYEFWKFISPGLKDKERNSSRGFIIIASFLFFIGVLFGYYLITPLSINFLGSYQVSDEVINQFDLDSYIGLVRTSVLACGIIFELPILMYILTKIGVVTPEILKKYRKFALIIVLVLSAVITPPDIVSQIIVAVPILILYEVSIRISKIVIKNQLKEEKRKKKEAARN